MSIVIGCDSFLSLRNVRNGDLGKRLTEATGEDVIVLADPAQLEGARSVTPPEIEIMPLIQFNHVQDPILSRLIHMSTCTRKSYLDPRTLWKSRRAAICRTHRGTSLRLFARLAYERIEMLRYGLAGRRGLAAGRREKVTTALRHHPVAEQYRSVLPDLDAKLVVGFSLEGLREMVLLEAANSLGIPTAVMIRSRDNLAAKIYHMPDAAAYLVWSESARSFFRHLYPELPSDRVAVTGTPQFDRHLNPGYRLPRDEFFRKIGLKSDQPLVVYSTATPGLIEHETSIVQKLADAISSGSVVDPHGRAAQLLVRPHPRGFGSDHVVLKEIPPGVAVYPPPGRFPCRSPEHEREVVGEILRDEPMHLSTLAYQDVQVNICGTMTIDTAILDKPVVNVYYDEPAKVLSGVSARSFYERTDYRPIVKSGGVRLAHSAQECLDLIRRYLENPRLDEAGRRWIREHDCGPLDGGAGRRIAQVLTDVCACGVIDPDLIEQTESLGVAG